MGSSAIVIGTLAIILYVIFFLFSKVRHLFKIFWFCTSVLLTILLIQGEYEQISSLWNDTWWADTWLGEINSLILVIMIIYFCWCNFYFIELRDRKKEIDAEFEEAKQMAHKQSVSNRIHAAANKKEYVDCE